MFHIYWYRSSGSTGKSPQDTKQQQLKHSSKCREDSLMCSYCMIAPSSIRPLANTKQSFIYDHAPFAHNLWYSTKDNNFEVLLFFKRINALFSVVSALKQTPFLLSEILTNARENKWKKTTALHESCNPMISLRGSHVEHSGIYFWARAYKLSWCGKDSALIKILLLNACLWSHFG